MSRFEGTQASAGPTTVGPHDSGRVGAELAPPPGVSAEALSRRIDEFLGSRGFRPEALNPHDFSRPAKAESQGLDVKSSSRDAPESALEFVCEEDVRGAIHAGRKLVVSERAIITPSARELGEAHRVFTLAPWPS